MMTYRNSTVLASVWQRLYSFLAHGCDTLHTWQQRRRERHYLRCLLSVDDRLLEDIGLNRFSAAWETRRPFWKPLATSDMRISQTKYSQTSGKGGETSPERVLQGQAKFSLRAPLEKPS
jgi:uncharacterized protein YjiS (DUF1127 family)